MLRSGSKCYPETDDSTEIDEDESESSTIETNDSGVPPNHWLCDQCSENADCTDGVCTCRDGWDGNGYKCEYKCPESFVWEDDRCIQTSDEDECKYAQHQMKTTS